MSEQNKALVRRLYEDIVNGRNMEKSRELCPPDYVHHDPSLPGGNIQGLDNYLHTIAFFFTAFPDLHITVEEVIADEEKVATRWTWTGTHQGDLMGMPPTGKTVSVPAISIHRVANGQLAEGWVNFDAMGLMRQLGAIPG